MTDTVAPERVVIRLTNPQFELVSSPFKFPAMVAGFGAGKTGALIKRSLAKKFEYPTLNGAYYLPTYDLVRKIGYPRFEETLAEHGLQEGRRKDYLINKSEHEIEIFGTGKIFFRTMDTPARIIGYEVADSQVDELDTLKADDAKEVWQKIIARNRQKKPDGAANTIAVGTTPEGFRFVYDNWKKKPPSSDYHLIKASTYSNARNLPDDYIPNLIDLYPPNLIEAYLNGEFVNLTSGAVYPNFDRTLNNCFTKIIPGEPLHIGMDFNVMKMAAVVFVMRDGNPHAVTELTGVFDTPAMIVLIKQRFQGHAIFVYPDASGQARKSNNASESDLTLLQAAGFNVLNNSTNPFVKDRVLSVNGMILAGSPARRRLMVNVDACPSFTEGLEKQAYDDKGEPDKTGGLDHAVDAGGYFICYRFPIVRNSASIARTSGT